MQVRAPGPVIIPQTAPPVRAASTYARALDPMAAIPRGEREQWAAAQQAYGLDRESLRIAALRRNAALAAANRTDRATTSADDSVESGGERNETAAHVTRRGG